jgi:hypothetical protein
MRVNKNTRIVDTWGFTVIRLVSASIDALVEKEVIPEVFNELI